MDWIFTFKTTAFNIMRQYIFFSIDLNLRNDPGVHIFVCIPPSFLLYLVGYLNLKLKVKLDFFPPFLLFFSHLNSHLIWRPDTKLTPVKEQFTDHHKRGRNWTKWKYRVDVCRLDSEKGEGGTDWEGEKKKEGYIWDSRMAAASLYFPGSQDELKSDEGRRREVGARTKKKWHTRMRKWGWKKNERRERHKWWHIANSF